MIERCGIGLIFLLLLASCTIPGAWTLDAIPSGETSFDTALLFYTDPKGSPLKLEFVRAESGIASFLSLAKYKFHDQEPLHAKFLIGEDTQESLLTPLEGSMKIKLPEDLAAHLIKALRKGEAVVILVDGFEQTLSPENFPKLYEELTGIGLFRINPLRRHL